ncbi:hypothetical protein Nepgr_023579 [Nepenthes gracilis]|uniref:Polymerase nucleotidyl transferase domain-containing protein n=1 Tax=Nepenthes gracilis TaxID=150966 RepID=A0AAD3T466_NEPGR|nr:hypothetical protein Nepgr_023579 [Nepenthes gracilis]
MGEHEERPQPSGLLANGIFPNESGSVIRALDAERWSKAEERTAELIACFQPNQPSDQRRNAVVDYLQRLIMKCFPCQVFTFGSVPLKTYLPDGDIDLTAFSKNQNLKDTWANKVRDILEIEEKNENSEFRVKEVQYIQAEVKIIKCLVEDIVVDISFNQLGGLCTLCFLEEVDHLINQNHLFKRSIILIKAWCYYESRILGAHHGLISTYALETLVLYIFNVFNNSFVGPLEVLYRFLEFFSNFDWDNFCVSLRGPIPISSLPDVIVEPPRKDSGELLLSKLFLDACSTVYAVFPGGQENQGQPFVCKHFNIMDPLRINNNLGRSVSKGNFFRIRSAFAFGAKRLARLLDCPTEDVIFELNQFFSNSWERHGSGNRTDVPTSDLWHLRLSYPGHLQGFDNHDSPSSIKKMNENSSDQSLEVDTSHNSGTKISHQTKERSSKPELMMTEVKGKCPFARTLSSPELTVTYNDALSKAESWEKRVIYARTDYRRKNVVSETFPQSTVFLTDDPSYVGHISSSRTVNAATEITSSSNIYLYDLGISYEDEESVSTGVQEMLQEEPGLVNIMASSVHNFCGHISMPLHVPSYLPLQISPLILASIGAQRNLAAKVPGNIPLMQLLLEDPIGQGNKSFGFMEMEPLEADNDFWEDQDSCLNGGFGSDQGSLEMLKAEDQQLSTSGSLNLVPTSRFDGSSSSMRAQQKFIKEDQRFMRLEFPETNEYCNNRVKNVCSDDTFASSRSSSVNEAGSWDGSVAKVSKMTREKRGRKTVASAALSSVYGKGNVDDDNRDWHIVSTIGTEMAESSSAAAWHFPVHHYYGYEVAKTSVSDSLIHIAPMVLGCRSTQRMMDNPGVLNSALYSMGPPMMPFITVLPVYNFPQETSTSDALPYQNFDLPEGCDENNESESLAGVTTEPSEDHNFDILNSDFAGHWRNLQYGRFCQDLQNHGPLIYPLSVVPPDYLWGPVPWDDRGRPMAENVYPFSKLISYGPHLTPIAPLQYVSNRLFGVNQHYVDEFPRYHSGTGTYLPNPKALVRDQHSSRTKSSNSSNHNRTEHHGGREGSWNTNSVLRASRRIRSRSQANKSRSRLDRSTANVGRADRPWGSYRHNSSPSHRSQNGSSPPNPNSSQTASQGVNPSGFTSNGMGVPSIVMLYPYDNNSLEFGSLGPVDFMGTATNLVSRLAEGTRTKGAFEEERVYGISAQWSPGDQPLSPHLQR